MSCYLQVLGFKLVKAHHQRGGPAASQPVQQHHKMVIDSKVYIVLSTHPWNCVEGAACVELQRVKVHHCAFCELLAAGFAPPTHFSLRLITAAVRAYHYATGSRSCRLNGACKDFKFIEIISLFDGKLDSARSNCRHIKAGKLKHSSDRMQSLMSLPPPLHSEQPAHHPPHTLLIDTRANLMQTYN